MNKVTIPKTLSHQYMQEAFTSNSHLWTIVQLKRQNNLSSAESIQTELKVMIFY